MCQKCLKVCASQPPYGKEKYWCFSLGLFKPQENRLPSFFIPSREALFCFPCLLAHHNKLVIFNSESSFRLGSNRITFFSHYWCQQNGKTQYVGTAGGRLAPLASAIYWKQMSENLNLSQYRSNERSHTSLVIFWKYKMYSTSKYKGFLPHFCMSPLLLRLPSVLALVFFILVIPGFASFPENCYCFVFPIHILFSFFFAAWRLSAVQV